MHHKISDKIKLIIFNIIEKRIKYLWKRILIKTLTLFLIYIWNIIDNDSNILLNLNGMQTSAIIIIITFFSIMGSAIAYENTLTNLTDNEEFQQQQDYKIRLSLFVMTISAVVLGSYFVKYEIEVENYKLLNNLISVAARQQELQDSIMQNRQNNNL